MSLFQRISKRLVRIDDSSGTQLKHTVSWANLDMTQSIVMENGTRIKLLTVIITVIETNLCIKVLETLSLKNFAVLNCEHKRISFLTGPPAILECSTD